MKGFIEVTREENNGKVLIAVEKITFVEQCLNGNAFIMLWNYGYKRDTINFGITTVETYAEVLAKIDRAAE